MKIGILQTAPNNCDALDRCARKYPGVRIIHFVDECLELCVDETDIIGLNQNPRHLGVDLVLFSRIQNKFQMNGGVTAY